MNEFTGEIVGVLMSADGNAVVIKLSNGTAVTFDARWPEDILTANPTGFQPPFWKPMHVESEK